jgi:hypothetical protein
MHIVACPALEPKNKKTDRATSGRFGVYKRKPRLNMHHASRGKGSLLGVGIGVSLPRRLITPPRSRRGGLHALPPRRARPDTWHEHGFHCHGTRPPVAIGTDIRPCQRARPERGREVRCSRTEWSAKRDTEERAPKMEPSPLVSVALRTIMSTPKKEGVAGRGASLPTQVPTQLGITFPGHPDYPIP